MKLIKARVENFKSIDDSDQFTLDQVTCLVGKNEAGKTAVLEALYKLNPVEKGTGDFSLEEYPRKHLTTYRKRMKEEPAKVVTTTWELEAYEVQWLEEQFCKGVLKSSTIEINKGYSNKQLWTIPLDEGSIVKSILAGANLNPHYSCSIFGIDRAWRDAEQGFAIWLRGGCGASHGAMAGRGEPECRQLLLETVRIVPEGAWCGGTDGLSGTCAECDDALPCLALRRGPRQMQNEPADRADDLDPELEQSP